LPRERVHCLARQPESQTLKQVLMKEFADGEGALPSTALRFFNVYGPRQDPANPYSGVISLFMEKGGLSKDVTILGDGEQTRDFVFVKDVARAIATALFQDEVNPCS
jgi:nucleoside-diphosphate-sugar epimerase